MALQIRPLARCCWCSGPFVKGLVTILGLEPWTCAQEACWRRQVKHAMIVELKGKGRRCRYVPVPRQVEVIELLKQPDGPTYLMIGGAAGGSKSKGTREIGHDACMTMPGFRVLLLRRTYKELEQTHLRDIETEAPEMGATAVPSAKVCRYPNGSVMQFGHCETAADAANYLSAEYDLIIFDELVTFEETPFLLIASRARSTKPGVQPKIVCGTNPGGPQSHWVRARFIDKTVDLEQFPDYRRRTGSSFRRSWKTTRISISSTRKSCWRCRRSCARRIGTAIGTSSLANISRNFGARPTSAPTIGCSPRISRAISGSIEASSSRVSSAGGCSMTAISIASRNTCSRARLRLRWAAKSRGGRRDSRG